MSGFSQFDVGRRIETNRTFRSSGAEAQRIRVEWPGWCERVGLVRKVDDREVEVPPLLGWERIGELEVWRIRLPGRFGDPGERSPREMIPVVLRSSRPGAVAAHGHEPEPSVLEVLVSFRPWPTRLAFDEDRLPTETQRVWVGDLADGAAALWDLAAEPHGVIAGQTGSGKSRTAQMLLEQFSRKGWSLSLFSPKLHDPIFSSFIGTNHDVVTGQSDETLEEIVDHCRELRHDRTLRQKLQAEYKAEKWADMPDEAKAEYPFRLVCFDESRSYFTGHAGESKERKSLRSEIIAAWCELVQEGRSAGHHGMVLCQSVNVESLGGGFAAEQLGFRLAVRTLDRKWWNTMFPESVADLSSLVNPATPPGRAIGRGLIAPETVFGSAHVQDAPLQIPLLDHTADTEPKQCAHNLRLRTERGLPGDHSISLEPADQLKPAVPQAWLISLVGFAAGLALLALALADFAGWKP